MVPVPRNTIAAAKTTAPPARLRFMVVDGILPPVDAFDRCELLLGQSSAPQHVEHEIRLAEYVAVDVIWKLRREFLLQVAVTACRVGMRAEIVAHGYLVDDADRALRTPIGSVSRQ